MDQSVGMSILQGLWNRYDGTRRNPFNQIECGDHYIRNAAGWSVLEALSGYRYNAIAATVTFAPLDIARDGTGWQLPFVTPTGWGVATHTNGTLTLDCKAGHLDVRSIHLDGTALPVDTPIHPGKPLVVATI